MHCLVTWLVMVSGPASDAAGTPAEMPLQTRTAWVRQVGDTLRRQATADDLDQPQVMLDLISLYHQLSADTRLRSSDRQRLQAKLRQRLWRVSRALSRDVERRVARIKTVRHAAAAKGQPERLASIHDDQRVLDRWQAVLAQAGPPAGVAGRGGAAGGLPDHGDQLVELIQAVISPAAWDVHGGPMAIVYYRHGRVLVVSATSEIHEQVGGLAEAMRRVGN